MEPLPGEAHHVVVEVDVVGVPVQREQSNNLKKKHEKKIKSKQIADAVWLTYKEWMWEKRSIKETLMHIKDSISSNLISKILFNVKYK